MKLLLVEDNDDLRYLLKKSLVSKDLDVIDAPNGVKALELFNETIDVVLTYVNMPLMNGLELLTKLKKLNPEIRVYVMSGNYDYESKAIKLGASGFFGDKSANKIYKMIVGLPNIC